MKEAFWGALIILLGLIGIVIMQVFQDITVTNDQTYYLLKEVTEASMLDSIDLTYYRTKGEIRIVKDKFAENIARRFAESANLNRDYNIVIHDILEDPPKVSLSIGTYSFSLQGDKFNIGQSLDSIIEAKYTAEEEGCDPATDPTCVVPPPTCVGENCEECKEGDTDCDGKCELGELCYECEGEECTACPICEAGDPNCGAITECITGDLKFVSWGNVAIPSKVCPTDSMVDKTRVANYQICECGKWKEQSQDVASTLTKTATEYTYSWHFLKSTNVRTIDLTSTKKGSFDKCTTSIDINCPSQLVVGQKHVIVPIYTPEDAANRDLEWTSSKTNIATVADSTIPPTTGFDNGTVTAKAVGRTTITATTTNSKSDSCEIEVVDNWRCPTPNPIKMYTNSTYKINSLIPGIKYSADSTYATIANDGTITSKNKVANIKYTMEVDGLDPLQCDLEITRNPNWRCPDTDIVMNINSVAQITLPNNFKPTGISYKIDNTSIAVVYSQGQIDSKGTGAEITYKVNAPDYSQIVCPLTIKAPSSSAGCAVGTMKASFTSKTLPALCPQDIEKKSSAYNNAVKISATPSFCGKDGNFTKCSAGKWVGGESVSFVSDKTFEPKDNSPGKVVSVSMSRDTNKYTITWSILYKYGGWSLKTEPCIGESNQYTITKTLSGTLKSSTAPECSNVVGQEVDPELGVANCPNELIAGSTAINLYASYAPATAYDPNKSGSPIKWSILSGGPGTIVKQSDNSGKYTPPSSVSGTKTVKIKMQIYDTKERTYADVYDCVFDVVPLMRCEEFKIVPDKAPVCLNESTILNLRYNDNSAFTSNAKWGVTGDTSAVKLSPSLTQYSTYLSVTVLKESVKSVTVSAEKQVGQCPQVGNPSYVFKIGKYIPNCSGTYYQLSDDNTYCYNPNGGSYPTTCSSGYKYYSGTGKCHPTDPVNSKTTETCSSGTKYYSYSKSRYVCGTTESKVCPDSTYKTDPNYTARCRKCPSGSNPDPNNSYKCRKCPDGFVPYNSEECKKRGMIGPYITVDYLYQYKECPNDEFSGTCYKYLKDTTRNTTYSCDYPYTLTTINSSRYCLLFAYGASDPTCSSGYKMRGTLCYYAPTPGKKCVEQ